MCDVCTCTGLCLTSLLLGELSPVACWRINWRAAWRACGHERGARRKRTQWWALHTHTFALCLHFLKITGEIHLALHGEAPPVCQTERQEHYRARTELSPLTETGKMLHHSFCVTLPHPIFLSLTQIISPQLALRSTLPCVQMTAVFVQTREFQHIYLSDGKREFSKQKHRATVNQWANSFMKSAIRMHICFLALRRERKVT